MNEEPCKIIALANQKGGVGKTTTTESLGVGLAKAGKRVLLVDADPQASLTVSLGSVPRTSLASRLRIFFSKCLTMTRLLPMPQSSITRRVLTCSRQISSCLHLKSA